MGPNYKSSDTDNLDMLKRSYKGLPLSKKVKILDLIRKGENPMLGLLRSMVRTSLLSVKL